MNTQVNSPKKIVIISGVAGGMSAAARLRRLSETAEIVIFERSGYVSYANCGLPYYLGGEIKTREALLLQTPDSLQKRFRLDVRVQHEVTAINPEQKTVTVRDMRTNQSVEESYDELILAVGAAPIRPRLAGLERDGVFTLRSIEDLDQIDGWMHTQKPKQAVVVGGGFIGLEVAEQLKHKGLSVTLVDSGNQVLKPLDADMVAWVHEELTQNGITLKLNATLSEIASPEAHPVEAGSAPPKVGWVKAGEGNPLPADLVIMGLGVRPEIGLAQQAGLTIGQRNGIQVNPQLQTSHPHIWAVGDAIEVTNPISQQETLIALGGPANRQGRIVANNIMGLTDAYNGTLGTAIIRVFGLTAASTGLNEGQLKQLNKPYEAIFLHPSHHASYYPGACRISLKVLFHPTTGVLYGAQAVGKEGVDKRMDVLATALKAGMTVRDLAELELSYSPPFGSAKDPINLAGMMGENVLDGLMTQAQWHEVGQNNLATTQQAFQLLDVRQPEEHAKGSIPDSINIPLDQLRQRLSELSKQTPVIAYCQSGQRSYFATRVLNQQGFKAKNLSGAYLTWHQATK